MEKVLSTKIHMFPAKLKLQHSRFLSCKKTKLVKKGRGKKYDRKFKGAISQGLYHVFYQNYDEIVT